MLIKYDDPMDIVELNLRVEIDTLKKMSICPRCGSNLCGIQSIFYYIQAFDYPEYIIPCCLKCVSFAAIHESYSLSTLLLDRYKEKVIEYLNNENLRKSILFRKFNRIGRPVKHLQNEILFRKFYHSDDPEMRSIRSDGWIYLNFNSLRALSKHFDKPINEIIILDLLKEGKSGLLSIKGIGLKYFKQLNKFVEKHTGKKII